MKTIKDPVEEEDLKALMQDIEQSDFVINEPENSRKRKRSGDAFDDDM